MYTELYNELKKCGKVKVNEPLAKHTSYKIGGPAKYFVIVEDTDKLIQLLQLLDAQGEKYVVLGSGSNLLARDEEYNGVVVKIQDTRYNIQENIIEIASGCSTVVIAQASIKAGLTGFEWGVGVPGTIGGAVRGNAGIPTGEMKDSVEKVEIYRNGEVVELSNQECGFGYRDSIFKRNSDIILHVWLKLHKGKNVDLQKKVFEYISYRNLTQPKGFSSGCIFKNAQFKMTDEKEVHKFPKEFIQRAMIPAGWLIDQCGLKGLRVGNAQVSDTHANFIVNLGGATAYDISTLIDMIKDKVYTSYGIELEEEIQII